MEEIANNKAREKKILIASVVGIITNVVLAAVKVTLGLISGSVAIMSDAVNNLTDSSSSLITIIGTKLASKKPDRNHPFGHGRIEYLTSMVIAVIVLVTGGEMLITSVKSIIHPEAVSFSAVSLIIIAVTILAKIVLGTYTQRVGRATNSGALIASGADAKSDALISLITLISAGIYLIWNISIDGYAGVILSAFIIKTGIEVLKDTLGKILGERAESDLADSLRSEIASMPEVIGVHDLILHNYGPDIYNGSVNIEVDSTSTTGELYPKIHAMQMKLAEKYHIYLVFGLYAIDTSSPMTVEISELLKKIGDENEHILGFHGICLDETTHTIYSDILLDFDADKFEIQQQVGDLISQKYPGWTPIITIDTEFA